MGSWTDPINWKSVSNGLGFSNDKAANAAKDQQQSVQNQIAAEKGVTAQEKQEGDSYYGGVADAAKNYKYSSRSNASDYIDASKNATNAYTGGLTSLQKNLNPGYQQLTNTALSNAGQAMSLADAQNPNNAVASGVRGLYNTQAQGIQNQGLADYGVLAALGGQATANTIGGAGLPMSGGQLAALQNSNLGQAGLAFGNAQNYANQLKTQGLQAGINQSNWAYDAGQQAQQTAQNALQNQSAFNQGIDQNIYGANSSLANNIFGTNQGLASTAYNIDSGLAGLKYGIQQSNDLNNLGIINQQYGAQQAADQAQAAAANASQQAKLGALGTLGGFAAGAYFGGGSGKGAAGGAAAGGGAAGGGGMSPMQAGVAGAGIGQAVAGGLATPAPIAPVSQAPALSGYRPGASLSAPGYAQPYAPPAYGSSPYGR